MVDLYQTKFKLLYVILPLIFLTLVSNNAYAIDYDLECPGNKIVVVRTTNPNPICVFDTTAERWIELGIAEIVSKTIEEIPVDTTPEILESFDQDTFEFQHSSIPDDLSRAQSYLITFSDGDFTESLTFQTFSNVAPGEEQK